MIRLADLLNAVLLALCTPQRAPGRGRPKSTSATLERQSLLLLVRRNGARWPIAFAANPASAGEVAYCLTCAGPDRTYLCRVTGDGASQNDIFKLYCIARAARKGRHASCAATGGAENCHGKLRTFKYRGPSIPAGLAESSRVKRFISEAEQDYRNTAEVSAATPPSDLPEDNASSSRWSMFQGMAHAAGAAQLQVLPLAISKLQPRELMTSRRWAGASPPDDVSMGAVFS
jgi:hypothetical protein